MDKSKARLLKLVDGFAGKKIAVWGDLILDEYLYGHTHRISREAPVLILSYKGKEISLGGAGNSLINLKALGANPLPVAVVGSDSAGKKIVQLLKQNRISIQTVLIEKDYQTPIKTRILAGEETAKKQQILRIDQEGKVPDRKVLKQKIQRSLTNIQKKSEALLISDYNYFTVKEDIFSRIHSVFKRANIPVSLDSRFRIMNFKGITISTPNEPEVEEALRVSLQDDSTAINKIGRLLLKGSEASAVLITRGSKGMILFERKKAPFFIPIHGTADIVDVTGAGDTVISVFTLSLACGASFREAAQLANYAGGVVVMKKGTATLTPQELKGAIIS